MMVEDAEKTALREENQALYNQIAQNAVTHAKQCAFLQTQLNQASAKSAELEGRVKALTEGPKPNGQPPKLNGKMGAGAAP